MKKVLVTGGAGFIGGHIVEEAVARGLEVVVLDNLKTGFLKNIQSFIDHKKIRFIKGSITDQTVYAECLKGVDTIFHLGALISVAESMEKEIEYGEVNTLGTIKLLKNARQFGVQNIVLSSSASVYGDNPIIPKKESMLPEPKSPYAVTKLDGEYYFKIYREEYGMNCTALRYFNVFGPRQDPKSQYAAAIPIFIDKALKNQDIIIFGDGEQTRDFIYVKDIVKANFLAAEKGGDVYNAAYGGRITINQLAEKIIQLTNSNSKIVHHPERPGDIKHSQADNNKIVNELGFAASADLESGLLETVEYFKSLS